MVAICDHLGLFRRSQLKSEIIGKALRVALNLLVQTFGGHSVDPCQVEVQDDSLPANLTDESVDIDWGWLNQAIRVSCQHSYNCTHTFA